MKKFTSLFLAILILLSIGLTGCGKEQKKPSPTVATEDPLKPADSKKMLQDYYDSFFEGDNPFYGMWQVEGISYVHFTFRNDNLAQMLMGTEAYFTEYTIDEKAKTIDVSFLITLNGTYKYEFSDDNNTLTFKQKSVKTVLKKVKNYDVIPEKPKTAKIDKRIVGWWKSDSGHIYYFGSDGLMYSNGIINETFYTYEAKDNVIHAVYQYNGDVKDNFGYEITKDGNLKIKTNTFTPYDPYK